tara:strand:+ start:53 stop:175 length:123 start_codon:yes stop_codon:yes gene_type:complete
MKTNWIVKEGNDIKPPMTDKQILAFKSQYPKEFNKTYQEV